MEKTKTNKKNKSSIVVLLVAILLCVAIVFSLSGVTLAKYISSKEVSTQKANVAKWGWQVGLDATDFFGTAYSDTDGNSSTQQVPVKADYTGKIGVKAGDSTTDYIVAPGTQCGQAMTFYIDGSAEVRSKISFTASGESTVQLTWTENSDSKVYEPIRWTLQYSSTASGEYSPVLYTESDGTYTVSLPSTAESSGGDAENNNGQNAAALTVSTYADGDTGNTGTDDTDTNESSTDSSKEVKNVSYADLKGVLGVLGDTVEAGEKFANEGYYKLSWAWQFEADDSDSDDSDSIYSEFSKDQANLYDTILGAVMTADQTNNAGEDKAYETTGGSGEYASTQIKVYYDTTNSKWVVKSLAAGKDWDTDSTSVVTYTATTKVEFGLSITVEQIQGTAATSSND